MTVSSLKPRLYIFAKAPRMGKVKTRLAADIGCVHAWRIYRAMTARIFREMRDPRWNTILYGIETSSAKTMKSELPCNFGGLWPAGLPRLQQCSGGLSERTALLFQGKGPVITVGTDIPSMKRADVATGFKALKRNDAVIGPAKDGGFWLIGLNAPARPDMFDGVRWSHPQTRVDMCTAINGKTAFLRELEDVDNLASYRRYCHC